MSQPTDHPTTEQPAPLRVWVVVPTYEEAENLGPIISAIQAYVPSATVLVVDDASPDGTGELADRMAAADSRVQVLHRAGKEGLGRAYLAGFEVALAAGADRIVQMDADFSHDPSYLPGLIAATADDPASGRRGADLAIGSRYVRGAGVVDWSPLRRLISRGGSTFAGIVLGLSQRDLTGGYKVWRTAVLEALPRDRVQAGGYVFQIEMTYLADRHGASIVELPIVFPDRRVGVSKMSKGIVAEAFTNVVRLRLDEIRHQGFSRRPEVDPVARRVA
ncbi:MAG: polyprenol monophosphomannose synthase [Candidatus Limnocylindrales bacterium]